MSFISILLKFLWFLFFHTNHSKSKVLFEKKEFLVNTNLSIDFNKENDWNPIRIHVDYSQIYNFSNLSDNFISSLKQVAEQGIKMAENLIKVKPLKNKLTIASCGKFELSKDIQTLGFETDLIIVLNFDNYTDTRGYSSICNYDPLTGRTTGGVISFTKSFNLKHNWLEFYTYVFFHELTHIMVFNDDLWSRFIDENGNKIPYEKVIKNTNEGYKIIKKIITPKVIEKARLHFNCSSLDGIELEDKGEKGSIGLHWKARYMLTDYMVSNMYEENTISEITLALFEDSGWYKVNYFTGGLFRFGKNQGCGFLFSDCIKNGKTLFHYEFCDDKSIPTCSNSRLFKGYCKVDTLINLKKEYQYFSNKEAGYRFTDYCPISTQPFSKLMYLSSSCINGRKDYYPLELEENISSNSACFISSLLNYKHSFVLMNYFNKNKAICYKYECDFNNNSLTVFIGKSSVLCHTEGGIINLKGYTGKIYCPDFNQICTKKEHCTTMIDCSINKVLGYSGTNNYNYKIQSYEIKGESFMIKNVENLTNWIENDYFFSNFKICVFILLLIMILTFLRSYAGLF